MILVPTTVNWVWSFILFSEKGFRQKIIKVVVMLIELWYLYKIRRLMNKSNKFAFVVVLGKSSVTGFKALVCDDKVSLRDTTDTSDSRPRGMMKRGSSI
jgi:FtsH-binding integral membrane protein